MSNSWDYQLLIEPRRMTESSIRTILAVVDDLGFRLRSSDDRPITGMHAEGWPDLEFDSEEDAIAFFTTHDGLFNIWHGCVDCSLTIYRAQVGQPVLLGDEWRDIDTQRFDGLTLGVDSVYFREDTLPDMPDRSDVADLAQRLFLQLARATGATFGVSMDEYNIEGLWPYLRFHDPALAHIPPGSLGWFNYFARDYFSQLDPSLFSQLDATIREDGNGVTVTLGPYPWSITHDDLLAINTRWRALTSTAP